MCSPLKGFLPTVTLRPTKISILTPQCAVWLRGVMHNAELDSTVGCTPQSLTPPWDAHCGLCYRGVMHTEELDLAVGCTPQDDAHCGAWPLGMMHTAESDSAVGCTLWSFLKIRISWQNLNRIWKYVYLGSRWVRIMKKMEVENIVTHSL